MTSDYESIKEPLITEIDDDFIKTQIKRSYPLLSDAEVEKTLKEIRKNQFKGGFKK